VWLIVAVLMAWAAAVWAEGAAITSRDWQYGELDALAQAGLLSGHPKGPMGEWAGERLTRFEAASLTLRAVEGVGKAYQEQGQALQQIAQATTGEAAEPSARASMEDVARVEKLIEEFRTELVTMGARVDDLATAIKDVQSRLAKVEADQKKHKISGYMQVRWRDDNASTGKQEFLVRRTRVNVAGPVTARAAYRVEFQLDAKEGSKGPGSKVQTRTAYIDYALGKGLVRFGQHILPWGYELMESVPTLWTGERALFMDRLFPDQRDIGVLYEYRKSPKSPQYDVGLYNGTSINTSDNNEAKNLMARVDFPVRNGTFAVSGYVGKNGEGVSETDQDRYGASARFSWPGGTTFLGEFVTGKDLGNDVQGWYAQVGHPLTDRQPNLLFVKYDEYDENRDAADDGFRRWSLGYWYQLDEATRLTLVHELRDAGPAFSELTKWDGNATYLQLQLRF
jgi:predicted heme/steroid binding protein